MNRYQAAVATTWALAALMGVASVIAWSTAVPTAPDNPHPRRDNDGKVTGPTAHYDTTGLAESSAKIRDHDPFRSVRQPTTVRFNPWAPAVDAVANPMPVAPRPVLSLVGLVGGPPWTAVVEGIPGREGGVLLRMGEAAGGIRLLEVRGDSVLLSGPDTIWRLRLRQGWQ